MNKNNIRQVFFLLVVLSLLLPCILLAQYTFSASGGIGATWVDVEKAAEVSELEDWSITSYALNLSMEKGFNNGYSLGGELGWQYLYYWEEAYLSTTGYRNWRWGDVATIHIGALGRKSLTQRVSVFSGLNLQVFTDESGTVIGIPLGLEFCLLNNSKFMVPVSFREDIVFGNDTPIAFTINVGMHYKPGF